LRHLNILRKNYNVLRRIVTYTAAVCFALAAASCSYLEKKGAGVAEARIVVGDVSMNWGNESIPVTAGMRFMPHNALVTGAASKIKMSAGGITIFVNEMSAFRFLLPTEAESCVIAAERGAYYFSVPAGGHSVLCRFGDMLIGVKAGTYAALTIDTSGRLAEFFVLGGRANIRRGRESKEISSCEVVVLDAAGISEDEAVTGERGAAMEWLKGWVGETVIDKALAQGLCKPGLDTTVSVEALAKWKRVVRRPAPTTAGPAAPKEAEMPVVQAPPPPPPPPQKAGAFSIEYIVGPRKIYSGEEFTLKCGTVGSAAVTKYAWRFEGVGELLISKTDEPQVTAVLEKTGEFIVTCEIMGDKGRLAAQAVKVNVVSGQVIVNAGGPYKAMLNKPVKLFGSVKLRKGRITQYEWYVTHSGNPDYVLTENASVSHTFTKSGDHAVVFAARLASGVVSSDTATVSVGSLPPSANAGADIVPKSDGKVKLKGTGSSPDGKIVKYEWDFDGNGTVDWSSESSGEVELVFKAFATPVLKVTDTEGNTAADTMRVVICPNDMVTVESGKFCVDKYEWPNRRGAAVQTNVNWHEAAQACQSVGKRLCAPDEWKRACRNGSEYRPVDGNSYPYGDDFNDHKCNTLGNNKSKNSLMPSGALNECAGIMGIYDMSGNAAEWTSSNSAKASAFGGFYQSGAEESGCESSVLLDKDKKYIYTGFRCCK